MNTVMQGFGFNINTMIEPDNDENSLIMLDINQFIKNGTSVLEFESDYIQEELRNASGGYDRTENDFIESYIENSLGINAQSEIDVSEMYYRMCLENQMSKMSDEDVRLLKRYREIKKQFSDDERILSEVIAEHPLSKYVDIRRFFLNDVADLRNEYNKFNQMNYFNQNYNNFYSQLSSPVYDNRYNFRQQQGFRNQYYDLSSMSSPYANNMYYGYNFQQPLYNYNYYDEDAPNMTQNEILNLLSKVVTKDDKTENVQGDQEYDKIYLELYNKASKYGTCDDSEIDTLVNVYGITDDKLNSQEHYEALQELRDQKKIFISMYVDGVLNQNGVYEQVKNMARNRFNNYLINRKEATTVDELNELIHEEERLAQSNNHKEFIRLVNKRRYDKFVKSDKYKDLHRVGSPMQIYNGYGSPNNQSLSRMLHEKKSNNKFYTLSENPTQFQMTDDGLDVTTDKRMLEAIKLRQARRAEAYAQGLHNHQ